MVGKTFIHAMEDFYWATFASSSDLGQVTGSPKYEPLLAIDVVQNRYPLCRNREKQTPFLQKRRRRRTAKIRPFFDVFINADA